MNTLSWLLYAAEASGGLRETSRVIVVVAGMSAGFATFFYFMARDICDDDDVPKAIGSSIKPLLIVMAISLLAGIIAPSRQTVMLIAASEAGETILSSNEAREIGGEAGALATDSMRLLRQFISEQIDDEASE